MSTTWTLADGDADLAVELWTEPEHKHKNHARLLVDGVEVDRGAAEEIGDVRLGAEAGHPTKVSWWWTGRPYAVCLVEDGVADERHRSLPFTPPPGTRAARLHAWGERHPHLWAARHVAFWALGVLGVSALVSALVRAVSGWVSLDWLPDLPSLPSIPWPAAPQWWTDLWTWVGDTITRLAGLLLGWVPEIPPWVKVVAGLLVAVAAAVSEVRRRRRHRERRPERDAT